jgi:hypothetical protein
LSVKAVGSDEGKKDQDWLRRDRWCRCEVSLTHKADLSGGWVVGLLEDGKKMDEVE